MAARTPYLLRRGDVFHFRIATPTRLRPYFGRELTQSLQTSDRQRAVPLSFELAAGAKRLFARTIARMSDLDPTPQEIADAVAALAEQELQEFKREAQQRRLMDLVDKKKLKLKIDELREQAEQHDDQLQAQERGHAREMEQARLRAENEALRQALAAQMPHRQVEQPKPSEPAKPEAQHRLSEVLPVWQQLRNNAKATVVIYSDAVKRFENCHSKLFVETIEREHIDKYIDWMQAEGLHAKTIEKEHGALRALLNIAIRKLRWIETNPASGTELPKARGANNKRRSFTPDELRQIFASPVFAQSLRPVRGKGEAALWLPLLMLYSGARREEVAQLTTDRVRTSDGVHYLAIDPIEDDGRLKTDESRRAIPVHDELVRIGFLEFVEERRKAGGGQLFPLLTPNARGQYGARWGDWWGKYVRDTVGITDKRTGPAHSFRHSFITECRRLEFREDYERALVGHVRGGGRKDAHDDYGEHLVPALAAAINRIDYRGLDLSHLHRH